MRRTIPAVMAALAGTLTLAACSGSAPSAGPMPFSPGATPSAGSTGFGPGATPPSFAPTSTAIPSPSLTTPIPVTPIPSVSISGVPAPATVSQARSAYQHLAAPVNRAAAAVNTDLAYGVPFALTRGDDLTYIAALRKSVSHLRAIGWPARVQGYVAAMLLTYPASIACAQAVASAGSDSAATDVLSTNQACARSRNASDPHEIRMLLHLPSTAGYLPGI
jgi:hypothetical protein